MRVDPATRSLYAIATISWPEKPNEQPLVTALDLRRYPPGVVPPCVVHFKENAGRHPLTQSFDSVSRLRHMSSPVHTAPWFHTFASAAKDVYERNIYDSRNFIQRSVITCRRRFDGLGSTLSLVGLAELRPAVDQSCEIRLSPTGYVRDDADTVIAAVLLLSKKREWKKFQSTLTKVELESCLWVAQLKADQKWDVDELESNAEDILV